MGIPSYFKRLSTTIKGLICNNRENSTNLRLYFDFNCLIYHVLRRDGIKPYDLENEDEWLDHFMNEIVKYTYKIINKVGVTKGVHIYFDGVVPMAKMKQQRMRRFKSSALKSESGEPSFNTNGITPGTQFMKKLSERIQKFIKDMKPLDQEWTLSDTSEKGEGEHKIMKAIRKHKEKDGNGSYVIYGLDADLIVLSLWDYVKTGRDIYLFRESIEGGEIEKNALGEEEFIWFSIKELAKYLISELGSIQKLEEYCSAMMILGNDFLPTSLTFRIKDGGHEELIEFIKKAGEKESLYKDSKICVDGYMKLFEQLSKDENRRMINMVRKKLGCKADFEKDPESIPLKWRAEECLVNVVEEEEGNKYYLKSDWRDIYTNKVFRSKELEDVAISEYIYGMKWIIDYYNGGNVSGEWYYKWGYPPLWGSINYKLRGKRGNSIWDQQTIVTDSEIEISEDMQLAMVLPLSSWSLIDNKSPYYHLPLYAPEIFPKEFELESFGKRWLWECEPEIPILSPKAIQYRVTKGLSI
jgi:5'-3' exonuclease